MLRFLLAGVLCAAVFTVAAHAQERAAAPSAVLLDVGARARLVEADTLLDFRTQPLEDGRFDVEEGVLRARYRIDDAPIVAGAPAAAARAYLQADAPRFGWKPPADDLEVVSVIEGRYSSHVVFQQMFHGLPVHDRRVRVNLDRNGRPTMAFSGYAPHLADVADFDPRPTRSAAEAVARLRQVVTTGDVTTTEPELVVYPTKSPRLAWRFVAWPTAGAAEWEVLVDAHTGELIRMQDQRTHAHAPVAEPISNPTPDPGSATPRAPVAAVAAVDGSGLAFDPDPITTAGRAYGPPFADDGDRDTPELNAERKQVVLRDITLGTDGKYRLEGPYAYVDGSRILGGTAFTPPAETDPNGFRYTRSNPFFEAVMVYYHIDSSQRYVQSIDVGFPIREYPTRVNPHGLGTWDNSQYYPSSDALAFGDGGIDDAEDGAVIWHEYAHALFQSVSPGHLNSSEGSAIHEGWADFWAASYIRSLIERGIVPERDWRRLFVWDGNETWCGRMLDHPGRYPDDTAYPDNGCIRLDEKYAQAVLWATTLMEVYTAVGRTVIDRVGLASLAYLQVPATFRDAAEALIQADRDLYGGAHVSVLLDVLDRRGYLDAAEYAPIVAHTGLPSTEQLGGTVTVTAEAWGNTVPVDSVYLVHWIGAAPHRRIVLTHVDENRYTGELPLPEVPDTVSYYFEAVDAAGQRIRLPAAAPAETFRFYAGPDLEPPRIEHLPMTSISVAGWPLPVTAAVRDNLGVDSVWVEYRVAAPDGSTTAQGTFGLSAGQGVYHGVFPPAGGVQEGSTVHYRIIARDEAEARNETVLPDAGMFAVTVQAEGPLRVFTFEGLDHGIQATGLWTRGAPAYGLTVAHSGAGVWGVARDRRYPDHSQTSTLELPAINLQGSSPAYLIFWHWYDFEHNGLAQPGRFAASAGLWDGANIKISTDGGRTWTVAEPEGGYNGIIDASGRYGNPLKDQKGFGGYSYGWRREIVALPAAADVRIRFDFATDGSNTDAARFFAGWMLDDVSITTIYPQDETAPRIESAPREQIVRPAGSNAPTIRIRAVDDTGIEAAFVIYEIDTASGATSDTLRLAMNTSDLERYVGTLPYAQTLAPGDRIRYHLLVRDFDGNTVRYPAPGQPPLLIEYLTMKQVNALAGARATGAWRPADDGWRLEGSEAASTSSLVLDPVDLPANAENLFFTLSHRYDLGEGLGGIVYVSADDGRTWTPLEPDGGGYPATYAADVPAGLRGRGVFAGSNTLTTTSFDLGAYAGRQIRLRIDLVAARPLEEREVWFVSSAALAFWTREDAFETPRALALHANYPDPFATTTTVGFTIPELLPVRLAVYDLLGRRVALLLHAERPAGTYTMTFDGSRLASGVYILRMEAGNRQLVERLVIAR